MKVSYVGLLALASIALLSCEKEPPAPIAEPAPPVQIAPPVEEADAEWEELMRVAGPKGVMYGRRRAPLVVKNDRVRRFIEENPDHPRRKEAELLYAFLWTRVLVTGAATDSARSVKRLPQTQWEEGVLKKDRLAGITSIVMAEFLEFSDGERKWDSGSLGPIDVSLPWGKQITIIKPASASYGLASVQSSIGRVFKRFSDMEGAPAEWKKNKSYLDSKLAINAALRSSLGGDLYNPKQPHKLNKTAAKKLASKLNRMANRDHFGLSSKQLALIFEPNIRIYDQAYWELKAYGFDKALKEYYDSNPAEYDMSSRHRKWVTDTGIADKMGVDSYYSSKAVGFWIRRLDDGTASIWRGSLDKLVKKLPPKAKPKKMPEATADDGPAPNAPPASQ